MSQENVEVVRRSFEAFQRGGPDAMLGLFSDDVITYRADPDGATFDGKAGFRDAAADWTEDFNEWQVLPQEFTDLGERVLVRVRQVAQGRSSGVRVDEDYWFLFEVTGSKVSKLSFYSKHPEALEAAGLQEEAMSPENVRIVRAHIEAWRAEDAPRAVSFLDPNVVADVSRTGGIDSAYFGREAITEYFRRYAGSFEGYRWEGLRLTDLGSGAVLAVMRETGQGKGSGVPVDRPLATLYTVMDGKIVRITTFRTEQEALEAAGLSE